jgi:hypothetical protein
MDESHQWYLHKAADGQVFGPVSLEQLQLWADQAQISPLDKVSNNGTSWLRAPMLEDLHMDYLVEVAHDQLYGPTTRGTIREFIAAGEITGDALVTNCCSGKESTADDLVGPLPNSEMSPPARNSIRVNLQQRIRELEELLVTERRNREMAEHLVEKLETQLSELREARR